MSNRWYLRTQDDTFGPETKERLIEWARMGRIQPGQEISSDGENWVSAVDVPFLDMRWSIDIGDGNPRGPFNKHAAQALLASGRLPKTSRLVETVPPPAPAEPDTPATPDETNEPAEPDTPTLSAEPDTPAEPPADESATAVDLADLTRALEEARAEADALRETCAARQKKHDEAARAWQAERDELVRQQEAERAARARQRETERANAATALKQIQDELVQVRAELADARGALSDAHAGQTERDNRIQLLSDEIKRLPASAQLAADAQAAMYALMKEEAEDLAATLEIEAKEAEAFRLARQKRTERLLARRQEILKHIGTDADDMTRRALLAHPEDPRTVHLRHELDALRILQEKTALESERQMSELVGKLRARETELTRLRQQAADQAVLYRQLQDTREKLQRREQELVKERQRAEAERQQYESAQQTLLTRLSALELGQPGATHQSREARSVRLAPWMGLKG